ncbi:MAG: hypothetical protein ACREOG_09610 [Gemmatimonadaceae bacterium]
MTHAIAMQAMPAYRQRASSSRTPAANEASPSPTNAIFTFVIVVMFDVFAPILGCARPGGNSVKVIPLTRA